MAVNGGGAEEVGITGVSACYSEDIGLVEGDIEPRASLRGGRRCRYGCLVFGRACFTDIPYGEEPVGKAHGEVAG